MKRNLFESYPYSHRTWSKGKLTLRRKRPVINCWKKWFVEESRDKDTWKANFNYSQHSLDKVHLPHLET